MADIQLNGGCSYGGTGCDGARQVLVNRKLRMTSSSESRAERDDGRTIVVLQRWSRADTERKRWIRAKDGGSVFPAPLELEVPASALQLQRLLIRQTTARRQRRLIAEPGVHIQS